MCLPTGRPDAHVSSSGRHPLCALDGVGDVWVAPRSGSLSLGWQDHPEARRPGFGAWLWVLEQGSYALCALVSFQVLMGVSFIYLSSSLSSWPVTGISFY